MKYPLDAYLIEPNFSMFFIWSGVFTQHMISLIVCVTLSSISHIRCVPRSSKHVAPRTTGCAMPLTSTVLSSGSTADWIWITLSSPSVRSPSWSAVKRSPIGTIHVCSRWRRWNDVVSLPKPLICSALKLVSPCHRPYLIRPCLTPAFVRFWMWLHQGESEICFLFFLDSLPSS